MHPMIDTLESRKLLAATLADGVLTVEGTARNDVIHVSLSSDGETITVRESSGGRFRRGEPTETEFAAADVESIVVNAGAGNDTITLSGKRRTPLEIPATLNGGEGDDNLFGAAGADSISGDAGDDLIAGGPGADSLFGGDGDDLIKARDGEVDVVDGGNDLATDDEEDADIAIADTADDDEETEDVVDDVTGATVEDFPRFGGFFGHHRGRGFHFGGFGFGGGRRGR